MLTELSIKHRQTIYRLLTDGGVCYFESSLALSAAYCAVTGSVGIDCSILEAFEWTVAGLVERDYVYLSLYRSIAVPSPHFAQCLAFDRWVLLVGTGLIKDRILRVAQEISGHIDRWGWASLCDKAALECKCSLEKRLAHSRPKITVRSNLISAGINSRRNTDRLP